MFERGSKAIFNYMGPHPTCHVASLSGQEVVILGDSYMGTDRVQVFFFGDGQIRHVYRNELSVPPTDGTLYSMVVNGEVQYGHTTANVITQYWEAYAKDGDTVIIQKHTPRVRRLDTRTGTC